jgi:sugar fermentation stimulation protein A
MDKLFGEALRYAHYSGVEVFAYDCRVGDNFITLNKPVEIRL